LLLEAFTPEYPLRLVVFVDDKEPSPGPVGQLHALASEE
jgi:hypothetical protein